MGYTSEQSRSSPAYITSFATVQSMEASKSSNPAVTHSFELSDERNEVYCTLESEPALDDTSYDSSDASSPPGPHKLRVMQWNIHGWRDTDHNDNFQDLLVAVRDSAPDVLVLNEVLHPYRAPADSEYFDTVKRGKGNGYTPPETPTEQQSYLAQLALATGLNHYAFGQAVDDGYFGRYGYGNAVLSRYPIEQVNCSVMLASQFEYTEGRRIEAEDRSVLRVDVLYDPSDAPLTVCTTHLDQLDENLRLQQMMAVVEQCPSSCMLVGDFNTYQASDYTDEGWAAITELWRKKKWGSPPERSPALEVLSALCFHDSHYLCPLNRGLKAEATCWTIEPLFRIDYCMFSKYLSRQWSVDSCTRDAEASCSDHFPIVVDLTQ